MKSSGHKSPWIDPDRALASSPAAAYLAGVGKGSRRTIQQSMTSLASMLTGAETDPTKVRWEKLRRADTIRLRSELKERFAPATANKMLSVLRGVLRAARDLKLMKEGDFQTAASLEMVKPSVAAPPIAITAKALKALFEACARDATASGRRDAALLAIFLCSGLRRAEASALDMSDWDAATGRLHIRGERPEYDRLVVLPKPARRAVGDWLVIRTAEPGPLLLPVDKGGLIRFRRMTDQAIYDIFGRIAGRAGIPGVTLRDLRRAYVVSLIRRGNAMEEVQYLVGHASWLTTASYRALAEKTAGPTYEIESIPYQPPRSTT